MRRFLLPALLMLVSACMLSGCTEPPVKEMNQARTALDAAQRAGANQYAADEYQAAVAAMKRSETAVSERDYKQALNYALDSQEWAQTAARLAAREKARVRNDAGRVINELQEAVTDATARIQAADAPKPRRRDLGEAKRTLTAAMVALQEAREAETREDYRTAIEQASAATTTLRSTIARIQTPVAAPEPRQRR